MGDNLLNWIKLRKKYRILHLQRFKCVCIQFLVLLIRCAKFKRNTHNWCPQLIYIVPTIPINIILS